MRYNQNTKHIRKLFLFAFNHQLKADFNQNPIVVLDAFTIFIKNSRLAVNLTVLRYSLHWFHYIYIQTRAIIWGKLMLNALWLAMVSDVWQTLKVNRKYTKIWIH